MAKETYYKAKETYRHTGIPEECACVKEDPVTCKKRPIDTAKEACSYGKRGLFRVAYLRYAIAMR